MGTMRSTPTRCYGNHTKPLSLPLDVIMKESQAAINALAYQQINSKLVWDCLQPLLTLASHNNRKVFASVEEIRQHRKCPVLQKRDDFPNTPFKEATIGEADEEAQDSPILQELQRKELLSYKFDLATSTPMPRIQEPVIFDKNRISDIQFDTEKSVPVVNKSIIRKTDSRVDSIKDEDHSSKRRVTFVETPGNIKNMDSGVREDKRDNTPDYSKEKTSCSPVTPATGIGSDQFYSAKSELEDFIPTRATGFSRHRPPAGGCTPLGVSFLSKVIPAKGNITASSDYHVSNKLEENHGVSTTPKNEDINTNEVDMDITCEHLPTSPIVYLENIEPRGDACKITTEASIVRNSNEKPTEIDRFDTANSEFNKVSSTPGFIRRRAPPLSERFAPVEVPQIQSKTNAQANKNALSDAPNLSIQKTFSAATSKDGSLNTSGPIEVSMELECSWENRKFESIEKCLPLSSINSSKSPSFSPRTRISEQSEEGPHYFELKGRVTQ
ncbi:unnamed protein product [Ceutorhynchus assimilis]|uniref:Uncharacterized protein n=1 Tax=Ceutorhynchus assimilis TaxID=467358 RepID=A0A9N9QHY4_9CUCU|nr:unnamed protein product [Ceutorhynchus assimilis]